MLLQEQVKEEKYNEPPTKAISKRADSAKIKQYNFKQTSVSGGQESTPKARLLIAGTL